MREIGSFEAKNKLGTVLDWVEAGEEVVITRRGRAVARLSPVVNALDRAAARAAATRIRETAKTYGHKFNWAEWKQDIDEGRA